MPLEVLFLPDAILALENGHVFKGVSVGCEGVALGELIFNTAMTGYQEVLTDPSYARQIVTLTYPHIGNTGINPEDMESRKVWLSGLVIRNLSSRVSNYRSQMSLSDFLKKERTVAISEVDTRHLATLIRTEGALGAALIAGEQAARMSRDDCVDMARQFGSLVDKNLTGEVSTDKISTWQEGIWQHDQGFSQPVISDVRAVAYDFGIKTNILRLLAEQGCQVQLVPADTSSEEALSLSPDGVFLSNGPGDPAGCTAAIESTKAFLALGLPVFGICLGHQILALACGAQTEKMKYGHHGVNHPVKDLASGQVLISSQNHGFMVSKQSLPKHLAITHLSLFDDSIQGISHKEIPAFGFQGHPEASPGPHEIQPLFSRFMSEMISYQEKKADSCQNAQTSKAF